MECDRFWGPARRAEPGRERSLRRCRKCHRHFISIPHTPCQFTAPTKTDCRGPTNSSTMPSFPKPYARPSRDTRICTRMAPQRPDFSQTCWGNPFEIWRILVSSAPRPQVAIQFCMPCHKNYLNYRCATRNAHTLFKWLMHHLQSRNYIACPPDFTRHTASFNSGLSRLYNAAV